MTVSAKIYIPGYETKRVQNKSVSQNVLFIKPLWPQVESLADLGPDTCNSSQDLHNQKAPSNFFGDTFQQGLQAVPQLRSSCTLLGIVLLITSNYYSLHKNYRTKTNVFMPQQKNVFYIGIQKIMLGCTTNYTMGLALGSESKEVLWDRSFLEHFPELTKPGGFWGTQYFLSHRPSKSKRNSSCTLFYLFGSTASTAFQVSSCPHLNESQVDLAKNGTLEASRSYFIFFIWGYIVFWMLQTGPLQAASWEQVDNWGTHQASKVTSKPSSKWHCT